MIVPSLLTICSGKAAAREEAEVERTSRPVPPNRRAGGASQTDTSSTSPRPMVYLTSSPDPSTSENS